MTYFRMNKLTLSSARSGFTSEFEKGSGGSHSLLSPDRLIVVPLDLFNKANKLNKVNLLQLLWGFNID
jgi:hypothetical protein